MQEFMQEFLDPMSSIGSRIASVITPTGDVRTFFFGDPAAADSIFEIGSVTKTFVALLLAIMVRSGAVALDEPVADFLLPSVRKTFFYADSPITLRHLATHTSGLLMNPTNLVLTDPWSRAEYGSDKLYAYLETARLQSPGVVRYSNLGFALLAYVLSLRAHSTFDDLVRERICGPLGMVDTRCNLLNEQKVRAVKAYDDDRRPVDFRTYSEVLAGQAGVKSTLSDMTAYIAAHMGIQKTPLLEDMRFCHEPRVEHSQKKYSVGLGWRSFEQSPDSSVIWHPGITERCCSFVGFTDKVGLVILSSSPLWSILKAEPRIIGALFSILERKALASD